MTAVDAVVFDLDGVLVDSEHIWDEVREELARERGGRWHERAQADMMGMSSPEWSRYMHEVIGLAESPDEITEEVVRRMQARYADELPLIDGAAEAVRRLEGSFRLGLASSSNRPLIDLVLEKSGLARSFAATVSSEEVARGKPAPDVFLEAARRLGVAPERSAAVEDSANGIRAARAAGMRVLAIPNRRYPPPPDALALADVVLVSLAELTVEAASGADVAPGPPHRERNEKTSTRGTRLRAKSANHAAPCSVHAAADEHARVVPAEPHRVR